MIKYVDGTGESNLYFTYILDYIFKIIIIIIRNSEPVKVNSLDNLIKHKDGNDYNTFDKGYLYVRYSNNAKFQYLIKKREAVFFEHHKYWKTNIEYLNNMQIQDKYKKW